ncbi:MAG: TonB family protein [Pyrinomonadaceae bacterium]|nr:TonB family protein [Pyrinomonadaceae bacterium]
MKKALTFALAFSCLAFGLSRSTFAQDNVTRTAVSVAAESGSREQDKLNGPVRRVRVEAASIIPKNGNWVEGPREVLGITTYDPTGKKIDSVVYPVQRNTLSGREQYLYDQKGNVVEMILRSPDGSMLSKESYKYEFDQLGNWTKMSSSVAVYENGKIVFEPTGITYRTISYYYNQAIEKLNAPSAKPKAVPAPSTSSTLLSNSTASSINSPRPLTPNTQVNATTPPLSRTVDEHAKTEMVTAPASVSPVKTEPVTAPASVSPVKTEPVTAPASLSPVKTEPITAPASVSPSLTSTAAPESPVATSSEIRTTPDKAPATSVVQHVAEEDLLKAAIDLPKPEYSDAALAAHASGKVTVQVLVDETGQVTTAQATSGHPLLAASAEGAARKARFSLAKVSPGGTKVYGVISYDFVPPKPAGASLAATSPTIEREPPKPADRKPAVSPIPDRAAFVETKPKASTNYPTTAKTFYDKGTALQASGRHSEAAEAFNQAVRLDPNDAQAYGRLAMSYSELQRHTEAIAVYKMAVQTDGTVLGAQAYYMWGQSYLALEKNSDALKAFKQALAITRADAIDQERKEVKDHPSLEQMHYALGITYLNSRNFGKSIDELKQVVSLNRKNAEAYYALAIAYLYDGNRREAEVQRKTLGSLDSALAEKISAVLAGATPPAGCRNVACR